MSQQTIYSVEVLKDNRLKLVIYNQTFVFTLESMPEDDADKAKHYACMLGSFLSEALKKLYFTPPPSENSVLSA